MVADRDKRVMAVDCGNTTTRAILMEIQGGEYGLLARGEAPTTVEKPYDDVTLGVRNAIREIEETTQGRYMDSQGIISPAKGNTGVDLFLATSSTGVAGYSKLQSWTHAPIMPTPEAVGKTFQRLAQAGENVIGVDIGTAGTDVFSILGGKYNHTAADLGMGSSLGNVLMDGGTEAIMGWLPFSLTPDKLRNKIRNKIIRPTTIPHTLEDLLMEQGIVREVLAQSLSRHKEIVALRTGASKGEVSMLDVDILVGTGGALALAPRPVQSAIMMIDALGPQGITGLAVDSSLMMPQLGVVTEIFPQVTPGLTRLGAVLAPMGKGRAGVEAVRGNVTWAGGSADLDMLWGEIRLLPGEGPFQVDIHPHPGLDFGAGRGRAIQREIIGGACGLVIDCRGRPLELASRAEDRLRQLLKWYVQVDMYAMFVEGLL